MPEEQMTKEYLELRKKIMETEFSHMNQMQKEAVFNTEGPLLIIAGAGSGKTTVLVNRIACILKYGRAYHSAEPRDFSPEDLEYLRDCLEKRNFGDERMRRLLAEGAAPPWSIMAITFTNKAANELKERLAGMLGGESDDIWACTFHSACARILRRDIDKLDRGYNRSFTIYDTDDSVRVIREFIKGEMDRSYASRTVLPTISRAKEKCMGAKAFAASVKDNARFERIAEIYYQYEEALRRANALDFDDMIMLTVELFEKCPDVLDYYKRRFRYILVDEYQDTNTVQYKLVSMLASGSHNLCVVGDDDQSIYGFRGATVENILAFDRQYKNASVVKLEQNYRSTSVILNAANAVIANNSDRHEKSLWTDKQGGEPIHICTFDDDSAESQYIANEILNSVKDGARFSDHAVLYRMNALSGSLEKALVRNGVPYRIIGGFRFYDRLEIKDIMAYLLVINNRNDDFHFKRILNVPKRGIGNTTVETAQEIAAENETSLYNVFERCAQIPALSKKSTVVQPLMEFFKNMRDDALTLLPHELIAQVIEKSGYLASLEAEDSKEAQDRIQNIKTLVSNAEDYENGQEEPSLSGFLEETALLTDLDNYEAGSDAVVLMTIHSAKGLEFPTVFIAGIEDGIFPSQSALMYPEEIEEERRLAYVGITRAKQRLVLTNSRSRMIFGKTSHNRSSKFADEIPEEYKQIEERYRHPEVRKMPRMMVKKQIRVNDGGIGVCHEGSQRMSFATGDTVEHGTFGQGMVISVRPMGSDTMLEIAFERYGTKKLMANYARLKKV